MIKLSKKVILFFMLVLNLFKQLVVGLGVFLFNRTLGSRMGVVICMGIIALVLMLCLFVLSLPANMASESPERIKNNAESASVSAEVSVEESYMPDESYQGDDVEDLLAQTDDTDTRTIEENIDNVDAFNFQVTEFDVSIGRSEPFAPQLFGPGVTTTSQGGMGTEDSLSAEELAKIEAEKRREEIRDTITNDVSIKGIVYEDSKDAEPMAIIEYTASDGAAIVQTVVPGDEIRLNTCSATVSVIEQSRIRFTSEDVEQSIRLPAFDDEDSENVMVSDDSYGDDDLGPDDLAAPPTPGGGDDSSITDAKKKIEEIDKLLDSF